MGRLATTWELMKSSWRVLGVVLYLFASTGKVPAGFAEQELRNAIAAA